MRIHSATRNETATRSAIRSETTIRGATKSVLQGVALKKNAIANIRTMTMIIIATPAVPVRLVRPARLAPPARPAARLDRPALLAPPARPARKAR